MNINRVFISSFVALYYLSFNVTDSEARQTVKAAVGQNVTLPCVYNVKENGLLEACWGRGEIPLFKCTNTVIAADGNKVTMRLSDRYQLLSGLDRGNVSLTIINVAKEDSGLYGCRIEIPGWFNDQKQHFFLTVEEAPSVRTPPLITVTTTKKFLTGTRNSRFNSSDHHVSAEINTHDQEKSRTLTANAVRLGVLVLALLSIICGLIHMIKRYARKQTGSPGSPLPDSATHQAVYMELIPPQPQV